MNPLDTLPDWGLKLAAALLVLTPIWVAWAFSTWGRLPREGDDE